MTADTTQRTRRVAQLDGLRGLAAVVVLFNHLLLSIPAVSDARDGHDRRELAWLVYSPLHILWDGTAAVWIFFVLSGYVLTSAVNRTKPAWLAYYPRRVLRLYLPVIGALVFAAVLMTLIPRVSGDEYGSVVNHGDVPLTLSQLLHDGLLLGGVSTIDGVLWSLQWEVMFSLLLPLYVAFAHFGRRLWLAKLAALAAIQLAGVATGYFFLFTMPIFGYGAVLFAERERISRMVTSWGRSKVLCLILVISLVLLNAPYWPFAVPASGWLSSLGSVLLVLLFLESSSAAAVGSAGLSQWLGKVSFSLYLTHQVLLLAIVALLGSQLLWLSLAVTLVVAFPVAHLFYGLVEAPAHRASQRVGRSLATRTAGGATPDHRERTQS